MEEQVQQFATVRGNITALLGESKGDGLLQKSMYIFSIGSNDIMEYLFSPLKTMTPEQFVINLTDAYAIHLKVPFTSKFLRITKAMGCGGHGLEHYFHIGSLIKWYTIPLLD
ncbi:hypothetical protein HanPSC8_Chr07g0285321 [Helianthus annuus]|nr:hypothetical protein HanPSC8_Chr07g0285321 [Helianthus annuus]